MEHKETDTQGITYALYVEQDHIPVRGNVSASGDDEEDRQIEEDVLARLNRGDTWAWANVTCEASLSGYTGYDYLGACSYENTEEFIAPGGYWEDMKSNAREELFANLKRASDAYRKVTA
jgi:hypothetical protein